jgi:hypothetical protein
MCAIECTKRNKAYMEEKARLNFNLGIDSEIGF